ncbi:thiamine phosphate synthase [Verrucomicrobia bacterium LW23]|nr:thiamine phosphate synthase [Verrucomicrobia bacterium LW23]
MNSAQRRLQFGRFYGILDLAYTGDRDPAQLAEEMLLGGVDILQLRAKNRTKGEILAVGEAVLPVVRSFGGIFIVNDYPEIACELDADGAHVGQEDYAVSAVRCILGAGKIVGKSTHSVEQAVNAAAEGPDYIGVGPLYATPTKPDYTPVGLRLIQQVRDRVTLPQFCIGGVNARTLPQVLAAGAERIVVVSALLKGEDVRGNCAAIRRMLDAHFGDALAAERR